MRIIMAKRNTYFEDEVVHKKIDIKQFGRILKYIMPYKNIFIIVSFLICFLYVLIYQSSFLKKVRTYK